MKKGSCSKHWEPLSPSRQPQERRLVRSTCSRSPAHQISRPLCSSITPRMWPSTFWRGQLTVFWGSQDKDAVPGSFFYQPRGTAHGFRNDGDAPARILYITVPAGFDKFMLENKT